MVWAVMAASALTMPLLRVCVRVCACVRVCVVEVEVKGAGRHDWDNKRHGI